MQTSEPSHAHCELAISFRIIRSPHVESAVPARIAVRPEVVTRKRPFCFLLGIRGQCRSLFLVLKTRALECKQGQCQSTKKDGDCDGGKKFHETFHPYFTTRKS